MKKLMTSTIILLPLLILAVMLVSGAIMSLITHIYVESVEFVENDTLVLVMSDEQSRPTEQLEVNVLPLKAANRGLVYSTENEDIVTVDENGVVTAQYYGETYITVTSAENKAATAKRKILVTDTSVHKLVINEEDAELYEGEPKELSVTVYPKEAENKSVTWTSSDESILHVSANGTVTPVGRGTATVTAVSNDNGEAKDTVTFTCHKKLKDLGVDQVGVVTSARTAKFPSVTRIPDDADADIAYKSSDPSVATVDGEGNIVFQKAGKVAITVIATDFGGKTVEKVKEFTSTDGYYLPPLFEKREYTVDFDTYFKDGKATEALPIPFATALEGSYQEFKEVTYDVEGVLTFDEDAKKFYFAGEMPAGTKTVTVTATARVYKTAEGAVSDYNDSFTLTVLRNASGVSLSYMGTPDVAHISTSSKTLKLYEGVKALPENHTNTVSYRLTEETDVASVDGSGTLTFQKAGEVTVRVELHGEGGAVTVYKELGVAYAPAAGGKSVSFTGEQRTASLLLSMAKSEAGILYFNEPAGADVTYAVEGGANAAVKLEERGGVKYIVSQKGGFANVEIKVVPKAAAADMGTPSAAAYTVRVYSDCPVRAENFVVKFNGEGTPCTQYFGTTAHETVPYIVTVDGADGAMEGKKLYVQYGSAKDAAANEGLPTQIGSIAFGKTLSTLKVTFGVEYGEEAAKLGAKDGLSDTERTIVRNAESIAVSHKGADAAKISTWQQTLTFTTGTTAGEETVNLSVLPANHTNTVVYSLTEGGEYAEITPAGVLTFKETTAAHSVKVKISLRAMDGSILAEPCKEIEIAYAPRGAEDKEVSLSDAQKEATLLLRMGDGTNDKGIIRFTEPGDATVTYKVTKGTAVKVVEESGTQHIVPQEGGFATVTVTVAPNAGGENKTYTVEVYVDNILHAEDLTFSFTDGVDTKGTTAEAVTFTVQANDGEGRMKGKRLIVTAAGNAEKKGKDDAATYTGSLTFPKSSAELTVTFGMEYTEEAQKFEASGGLAISKTATVGRNAEEIKVTYDGVQTEKILTSEQTVSFGEKDAQAIVEITPVHTDVLSYTLEDKSGVAKLNGGTLTFQEAGAVTVKIQLKRGGEVTLKKDISVTYAPVAEKTQEKVEIGKDEGTSSDAPVKIVLPTENGETKDGVIYFTEPEGTEVTYAVEEGAEAAVKVEKNADGVWHIIAQKGGFATIVITVTPKAGSMRITRSVRTMSATETRYIKVYVDKPVSESDFTIEFKTNNKILDHAAEGENVFHTCYDKVSYTVTVADADGSMDGKRLYVTLDDATRLATDEEGALTLSGSNVKLEGTDYHNFTFGVEYTEEAKELIGENGNGITSVDRKMLSSQGTLLSKPTITYHKGAYSEKNTENLTLNPDEPPHLIFTDVGSKFSLGVVGLNAGERSGLLNPIDLQDKYMSFAFNANGYATSPVKLTGSDAIKIVASPAYKPLQIELTAQRLCTNEKIYIEIFGQTFEFNVSVIALAQTIEVKGGTGTDMKELSEVMKYKTLLDSLDFEVTIGRNDTVDITNKNIQWSFDNSNWETVTSSSTITNFSVPMKDSPGNSLFFRSEDGGASIQIRLDKVTIDDVKFDYSLSVTGSDGKNIFATIGSDQIGTDIPLSYVVPGDMQGAITFQINYLEKEKFLGGFGTQQEFEDNTKGSVSDPADGWNVSYESNSAQIIFSSQKTSDFTMKCEVSYYGKKVAVTFTHYNLSIEFPGFDGENTSDIYKGYQQVRVFAKHSYYNSADGLVDYFKLPLKAINNTGAEKNIPVEGLTWHFVGYKGDAKMDGDESFELEQTGTEVTFNGVTYTVVKNEEGKPSTLQAADGTVIAQGGRYAAEQKHVPWVDVYAETGFAHLYFGEFTGLSEVDVQNDYFGNFDNRETWTQPDANPNDNSGRVFTPSAGAFTFLRVDAGFDASYQEQNKRACYFNFNVLADEALVNVFDAAGYCVSTNTKVVLHENLYGPTENPEAPAAQILRDTTKGNLSKNTIYGNGNKVNLEAFNGTMDKKNESNYITFERLYNVKMMGDSAKETLNQTLQKVYFAVKYAYYCDMQYYWKLDPMNDSAGMPMYVKNTVFSCVAKTAIQVYYGSKLYAENITLVECAAGISIENNAEAQVYLKGDFDVLDYQNKTGLTNMAEMVGAVYDQVVPNIKEYLEWHGQTVPEVSANDGANPDLDRFYVNVVIYMSVLAQDRVCSWNDETHQYENDGSGTVKIAGNRNILNKPLMEGFSYSAWTYAYKNDTEGGIITINGPKVNATRNGMGNIFTEERYIRLLCEYKNPGEKNEAHILWHMQNVYRDKSLIVGRKSHMENLKESLKGVTWPDGTTYEQAIEAEAQANAAALTAMLSETVLPSKHPFE